jgi:hypothetical protein
MNNFYLLTRFLLGKILITVFLLSSIASLHAQTHTEQNGIKTSVIGNLSANATQARRFEVATVGYNSYHWQDGGIIIVELFQYYYGTGYEKYSIEIGHGQGGQGVPVVKLLESEGKYHLAKITLGDYSDLKSDYGNKVNRSIPIYVDIKDYGRYKVKLTYMQPSVTEVTSVNQIKINESPTAINIPTFAVPTVNKIVEAQLVVGKQVDPVNFGSIDRIKITPYRHGAGPWIIRSRDIEGIANLDLVYGNTNLVSFHHNNKVDINGSLRANEVKVEAVSWSDFVFDKDYKLPSLEVVEAYINENKHLPDIPKESEVKEEGINVAEMQAKLLQKIEELTLYMIEQDKLNKEQAKQIQNQSKEIEELKRQIKSH